MSVSGIKTVKTILITFLLIGVLNTSWGDFANPASIELSIYSIVLSAAKSWAVAAKLFGGEAETAVSMKEWIKKYKAKWLEKNKESEISKIEEMVLYVDSLD